METETLHCAEGNEIWKFKHLNFSLSLPLSPCAGECPALGVHMKAKEQQRGTSLGAHMAGEMLTNNIVNR